jgi:hypothetical protein
VRVYQGFAGYWIHGFLRVLISYGLSSVWAMAQTSPKIFSFEHGHGQGEKTNKNLSLLCGD